MAPDSTSNVADIKACKIEPILEKGVFAENDVQEINGNVIQRKGKIQNNNDDDDAIKEKPELFKAKIRWIPFATHSFLHAGMFYGFYLMLTTAKLYTTLFGK